LVEAIIDAERDPGIQFAGLFVNGTASPDYTKNNLVVSTGINASRETLTDFNRNQITDEAVSVEPDAIYWWDDDTTHPAGALRALLDLQVPFAAGVYHLKAAPYVPVAYFRNPNGSYRSMINFTLGELVEVDFCGMGCALIRREVYEDIRNAHSVYKTERGSYIVVEKKNEFDVGDDYDAFLGRSGENVVVNGKYSIQAVRPVPEDEAKTLKLHFPWYGMEVTRTEDVWFCELASHVGVKPLIDTSVQCGHWGESPTEREHFKLYEFWGKEEADGKVVQAEAE